NSLLGLSLTVLVIGASATTSRASQAQEPQAGPCDEAIPTLPLESPAIAEIAARNRSQFEVRHIPREIQQARAEQARRKALEATTRAIQNLALEHKQYLSVVLPTHKRITGRVLSADATAFTIRARYSHQETTIRYNEMTEGNILPTAARQVLETTAL